MNERISRGFIKAKLKEVLGCMRTWWNNYWKKYEAEMEKWKEEDPDSYYAYMEQQLGYMRGNY